HERRRVHRGDPDGGDAEVVQIVQARGDAFEVADSVAVRVLEAARINFINHGMLPPRILRRLSGCALRSSRRRRLLCSNWYRSKAEPERRSEERRVGKAWRRGEWASGY